MAKGRRDHASTERRPPRSQSWRHPVAHSSWAAGCSFLARTLEGGQGAVRPHGSLGTEPRLLSGHESGPWHQECGSSPVIQNCLYRDHSCSGGSHFFCPLGARQGQEQRWSLTLSFWYICLLSSYTFPFDFLYSPFKIFILNLYLRV